jgi:hypothetical protein
MRTILFECPFTGAAISTGIETEPISFCRISKKWLRVYCPACCRFHGAKIWLNPESSPARAKQDCKSTRAGEGLADEAMG